MPRNILRGGRRHYQPYVNNTLRHACFFVVFFTVKFNYLRPEVCPVRLDA